MHRSQHGYCGWGGGADVLKFLKPSPSPWAVGLHAQSVSWLVGCVGNKKGQSVRRRDLSGLSSGILVNWAPGGLTAERARQSTCISGLGLSRCLWICSWGGAGGRNRHLWELLYLPRSSLPATPEDVVRRQEAVAAARLKMQGELDAQVERHKEKLRQPPTGSEV